MIKRVIGGAKNNGTMGGKVETIEVVGNKVSFELVKVNKGKLDIDIFVANYDGLVLTKPCATEEAVRICDVLMGARMITPGDIARDAQIKQILIWDRIIVAEFWQQFMKLKERYAPIDVEEEKKKGAIADKFDCGCHTLYSCPHIEEDRKNNRVDKVNRVEAIIPRHEQTLLKTINDIVNKALDLFKTKNTTKDLLSSSKSILGKGGELDGVMRLLKYIPFESRTVIGLKLNEAKDTIQEAISERMREFMVEMEPKANPVVSSSNTGTVTTWKDDKGNIVKTVTVPKTVLSAAHLIEMAISLVDDDVMDYKDKFFALFDGIVPKEKIREPLVREYEPVPVQEAVPAKEVPPHTKEDVIEGPQTIWTNQKTVKQISEEIILDFENDKSSEYFVDGDKYLIKNLNYSAIIPGTFAYTRVVDGKFKGSVWPIVVLESGAMGVIRCKEPAEGYKNPITIKVFYDADPILGIEKVLNTDKLGDNFNQEDLDSLERKLNNSEKEVVETAKKTLIALEDKARLGEKLSKCKCSCCNCVDEDSAAKQYRFRDD